jgi:hypothetical protein
VPPPDAMLDDLSRPKDEILALLRSTENGWSAEDRQELFTERTCISRRDGRLPPTNAACRMLETCIVEWPNRNPAASQAGRRSWSGRPESPGAVVPPFGTEAAAHSFLHAEYWPAWYEALSALSIKR